MRRKDSPVPSIVKKWVKMYLQGASAAELAESFDYSPTTILRYLRCAGVQTRTCKEAVAVTLRRGRRRPPTGDAHYNWKGGRSCVGKGYIKVFCPNHPRATNGYVLEHILKMEEKIGRFIGRNEIVHHKNGDITDNRLCNLELMSHSEHVLLHQGVPLNICWEMWKVYQQGESLARTAALFDVNVETVRNAFRRIGKSLRSMRASYTLRNTKQRREDRWYRQKATTKDGKR